MTDAEIVRRLAEYEGWTRIRPVKDGETVPIEETSGLFGLAPLGLMQWFVPDYLNDVAAALRVCERVCRERGLQLSIECEPVDDWFVVFVDSSKPEIRWIDAVAPTLARAAALAACEAINAKT